MVSGAPDWQPTRVALTWKILARQWFTATAVCQIDHMKAASFLPLSFCQTSSQLRGHVMWNSDCHFSWIGFSKQGHFDGYHFNTPTSPTIRVHHSESGLRYIRNCSKLEVFITFAANYKCEAGGGSFDSKEKQGWFRGQSSWTKMWSQTSNCPGRCA